MWLLEACLDSPSTIITVSNEFDVAPRGPTKGSVSSLLLGLARFLTHALPTKEDEGVRVLSVLDQTIILFGRY